MLFQKLHKDVLRRPIPKRRQPQSLKVNFIHKFFPDLIFGGITKTNRTGGTTIKFH